MYEENSVNNYGVELAGASQVDAGGDEQNDEADVQGEGAEQSAETADNDTGVGGPGGTQKDIDTAFWRERRRIQEKLERDYASKMQSDPSYRLGEMIIADLMAAGISRDEAVKQARQNIITAQARRQNIDPAIAGQLAEMREFMSAQSRPADNSPDAQMTAEKQRILGELSDLQESGELPEGFDFAAALKDTGFATNLIKKRWPVEAAVLNYMAKQQAAQAPQQIADKLRAQQRLPQSGNPQKKTSPERDFSSMSDEDFNKFDQNVHRDLGVGYYDI